jgi:soluble lytic murein transglycosylase
MAARLPGVDTFGARPTPQPGRGYAGGGGQGYGVPAPVGTRQLASAYEGLGESIYRGGAAVADIEREKKEKQDRYDYAAAKSDFYRKKVALDNSFDDDPDYTTYGTRYEKAIKDVRSESGALIKDPERRKLFDLEAGDAETQGLAQIGKRAQVKEHDAGRGFLLDTINNNMNAALTAKDERTREQLLLSTQSALVTAREKGYITAEKEAELRRSTGESYAERSLKAMPPEEQLKLLIPGKTSDTPSTSGESYFKRIAKIESNNDPNAVNPKSGASGKYQFMPDTARQYGIDPMNPEQAEAGVRRFRADNAAVLTKNLGRAPTEQEEYLAHQQGATGASALLMNQDKPALEVLAGVYGGNRAKAAKAITQNGGSLSMTAGEFAAVQKERYGQPETQIATADPTYDFQTKTNTIVDYLPADKRLLLIEQAQNKLKEGKTQFRADVNTRYDNALADIRANGSTNVVSEGEIRSAYADQPLRAEALVKNLREEKTFYGARQAVKFTSPAEDELMLKTWAPQGENAAMTTPRYEALVRAVGEKRRALAEDPGGYVMKTSLQVQAAFTEAQRDPAKMPAALELSDQTQAQLGVPSFDRRYLGKDQAEAMVRQVSSLKGEKMADAMETMARQYGSYWPQVFRELSEHKLPDNMSVLATVDSPVARQRVAEALTAENERKGALRQLAGQDAKGIDDDVASAMEPFRQSMASAPNGTQIVDRYQDTTKLLAYKYASQGMKPSQAAKQAAADVILDKYEFGSYGPMTVRAPKGRLADAERWARTTLNGLAPEELAVPPARPGETLTIQQREQAYAQAVKRGVWVTNENDDGWMLLDPSGQPVTRKGGWTVGFKFNEIGAAPVSTPSLDFVAP